ncbi:hypothetical protein V6N12_025603 [Hibiscus sabdariffa]|uniref:Uncharacterized protein n=1 Tax=Hibiscus sabdariffa TaxID=183260 RepID=A0ABR2CJF4_9ROSI
MTRGSLCWLEVNRPLLDREIMPKDSPGPFRGATLPNAVNPVVESVIANSSSKNFYNKSKILAFNSKVLNPLKEVNGRNAIQGANGDKLPSSGRVIAFHLRRRVRQVFIMS